jgi:hypothetical protein
VEQGKQLKRLMKEKQRRSAIAGVQDSRNTKDISIQRIMMQKPELMDFGSAGETR